MSSARFSCLIENCKHFGKVLYVEYSLFKKHLARDHDRDELYELAYRMGIIEDPFRYHNPSYVIQKIADLCVIKELKNGT
ncbi:MAG TPA: hypothetical protein VGR54_07405 [Nitrosopumilaceae archaeon]|nr:hypothetical protein [Nitrosopumilaceae archaeon]